MENHRDHQSSPLAKVGGKLPVRMLSVVAALSLGACQTTAEPRIEVREVLTPVAVKCATDPGPRPEYPDTDAAIAAASGPEAIFTLAQLYRAGRALRIGREAELEAAVSGCR